MASVGAAWRVVATGGDAVTAVEAEPSRPVADRTVVGLGGPAPAPPLAARVVVGPGAVVGTGGAEVPSAAAVTAVGVGVSVGEDVVPELATSAWRADVTGP